MSLSLTNATALGLELRVDYFGESLSYRRTKTITVSGYLVDVTQAAYEDGAIGDIESNINTAAIGGLSVNGFDVGSGSLVSISFSAEDDLALRRYTASFEVYEDGSIEIGDIPASSFKYIESVSEDFSSELQSTTSAKQCSHNVTVKIKNHPSDGFAAAKTLASQLLSSESFEYIGILFGTTASSCNTLYSEKYDKVNFECSFSKDYEIPKDSLEYIKNVSHSFSFDEGGLITVQESAQYKSGVSCVSSAFAALQSDIQSAYGRCSTVFNNYKTGDTDTLKETPIKKQLSKAENDGTCSYSIEFSNNPFVFWSYTNEISVGGDGIISVSESGEITGEGVIIEQKKASANQKWTEVKSGIQERLTAFYLTHKASISSYSQSCSSGTNIYLNSKSVTKTARSGKISYQYDYNNDSSRETGDANFKKIVTKCSDSPLDGNIILNSNYLVPNAKEIKQYSKNFKEEALTSDITLYGKDEKVSFDQYKSKVESAESAESATCKGDFLISASYEYEPQSNRFTSSKQYMKVKCE